jgi:hypothetical protein
MSGSSCNINIVISDSKIVYSALTLENVIKCSLSLRLRLQILFFFSSLYYAAILYTPKKCKSLA